MEITKREFIEKSAKVSSKLVLEISKDDKELSMVLTLYGSMLTAKLFTELFDKKEED